MSEKNKQELIQLKDIMDNWTIGSMSERVLQTLRIAIISHILVSGDRMVEAKLAKAMDVSITPVRYAYTQLSKEGLIDIYPYKGTYVKELTNKFVREVCALRAILEREAALSAFDKLTSEDISDMQAQIDKLYNSLASYHYLFEPCRADTGFHDIIFRKSGNDTLIEFWESIKVRMEYITSFTKLRTTPDEQKARHMLLLDDIRSQEKEKFLEDVYQHCIRPNKDFFKD